MLMLLLLLFGFQLNLHEQTVKYPIVLPNIFYQRSVNIIDGAISEIESMVAVVVVVVAVVVSGFVSYSNVP